MVPRVHSLLANLNLSPPCQHTKIKATRSSDGRTTSKEIKCIGATTLEEYRKHIVKDPALERRFQPVRVPEPTVDEAIEILKGLRERYEIHHKLRYTDEALAAAAQLVLVKGFHA